MKNSPLQIGRAKTQMLHQHVDGISAGPDLRKDRPQLGRQARFRPPVIDSRTSRQ